VELRHLTDEEIQDYLDGNIPEENKYVQEHLRTCERCRKALLGYQNLYLGLKKEQGFELPSNFPKTVISKLPEEEIEKSRPKYYEFALIILGIAVAGLVGFHLIDLRPLIQTFSGMPIPKFAFISTFFDSFISLLKILNINTSLVIFSALTIIIIKVLDYIILHPKGKPISSLI
jgi:hypothetical protein